MSNCLICMNSIIRKGIYSLFFKPKICHECFLKMNRNINKKVLNGIAIYSLYPYEEFLTSLIYSFKGCYDIALAPCFLTYDLFFLKLIFHDYYLVCVPSFKEHDFKRGFNHVEEIFKELKLPILNILMKNKDFKQSSLTAKERKESVNHIVRISDDSLVDKKILLVDDVITTGSTLSRSLELLKELNPKSLKVITIAYKVVV